MLMNQMNNAAIYQTPWPNMHSRDSPPVHAMEQREPQIYARGGNVSFPTPQMHNQGVTPHAKSRRPKQAP